MKYSEKDMAALISEVEKEFSAHLAKAESEQEEIENLNKSEEKEEIEAVESSEDISLDYDEADIAEMDKLYSSMDKSEAETHFKSLVKTLYGEEVNENIEKSEDENIEKSEDISGLLKSELSSVKAENEKLKVKSNKLEKSFQDLTTVLTKLVKGSNTAPKQKAITKIAYITKSEDDFNLEKKEKAKEDVTKLTKSEIGKRLTAKIRSGKLSKEERSKIDDFYFGDTDIESIKHLL